MPMTEYNFSIKIKNTETGKVHYKTNNYSSDLESIKNQVFEIINTVILSSDLEIENVRIMKVAI